MGYLSRYFTAVKNLRRPFLHTLGLRRRAVPWQKWANILHQSDHSGRHARNTEPKTHESRYDAGSDLHTRMHCLNGAQPGSNGNLLRIS